jgi:uncharacterized protein (TIGR03663 family)
MSDLQNEPQKQSWLDRPIFSFLPALTGEMLIFLLIVLLTALSRLTNLGQRVMSHDENLHTYFSWLFSQGKGYQHTPLMHGPLLFHLTALSYIVLGASDFVSRFPEAISSILTVILLWKWRRYLGRAGTLVAATLILISPFMLYYGRYARNEAFVALFGVLTLYAILRYFETGRSRYLVLLTLATALHFTSKETAFIYTAQAMLFLAAYLVYRVSRRPWTRNSSVYNSFIIFLSIGILLIGVTLGVAVYNRTQLATDASQTAAPILPGQTPSVSQAHIGPLSSVSIILLIAGLAFLAAIIIMILGYGWENLRKERSFAMLILLGTFVLPQLAAFPVTALGWDPLDYQFTWPGWNFSALLAQAPVRTGIVFLILTILSIAIGLLWNGKRWLGYAALFWGIYVVLFTSVFSNWQGFFTGTVGSLGYWLVQQGVHRGDQPWYYYLLVQIPIYEFLPALGLWLAVYLGIRRKSPQSLPSDSPLIKSDEVAAESPATPLTEAGNENNTSEGNYLFPLLVWWSFSSILAYTLAGEKMPWLTVHMALPMILITGWGLGQLIERISWQEIMKRRGVLVMMLFTTLFLGLAGALAISLGTNPPFQGKTLTQLSATGAFLLSACVSLASAGGLAVTLGGWLVRDTLRTAVLVLFGLLAFLTGRTAFRAVYINYDNATEYLVYAHGATGIRDVMNQVAKISSRIAGEHNLDLAYDNNLPKQGLSWSFKWYLRDYPNAKSFNRPDDSLQGTPVIIVDVNNFEPIKPIVGDNYYQMDFIRMVWPNQDYFSLTWSRIRNAFANPALREGIFQIWLNRDYSVYAAATGESGLTLSDWQPSDKMELFIRKDIAAQIWEYGITQGISIQAEPYEKGTLTLASDLIFGSSNVLNAPRGVAVAPDGSLLVADSRNNLIQHFDESGKLLETIGEASPGCPYDQLPPASILLGTFCEPWAVTTSPDGQWIYVADTWNHRIQKLTAEGKPEKAWGEPNYDPVSSGPFGLWGPRGIVVDAFGHVLVADTGNKRVIVYDSDGNFISQFGGSGISPGQFEEPVGLAIDSQGNLYVADTWNQRIQVFDPNSDGTIYSPLREWPISGWNGESLDNKPYLAVDQNGNVFATDPEGFRVLEFSSIGDFIRTWGNYGTGPDNFGLASGIAVDQEGHLWVSDTANDRLMRFTLPK